MTLESFRVVTLNHQRAPIQVREQFSFSDHETIDFLQQLSASFEISEVLLLATCNRTELYYVSPKSLSSEILSFILSWKNLNHQPNLGDYFEELPEGLPGLRHLFEVSVGLKSSVLGDLQIAGQMKQAYQLAHEAKTAGAFIHRLLHTIFHFNKRIQQETAWRDGIASVSYASVVILEECLASLTQPNILIIGCGEMGADAAKSVISRESGNLTLTNRTFDKAKILAQELNCQAVVIDDALKNIHCYDGVIVAVNSPEPVLKLSHFESKHITKGLTIVDLGLPRSVCPEVEVVPQVLLYNLDEIKAKIDVTIQKRMAAIPDVQAILTEELGKIKLWSQELIISPVIQHLKNTFEVFRQEELNRFGKGQSPETQQMLDAFSKALIQKLLKHPVVHLKSACLRGEQEQLVDAIRQLFDIQENSVVGR